MSELSQSQRDEALARIKQGADVLVIRMNHSNAGFFAQVTFALNQLTYCEKNELVPVVYYGQESQDGPNAFYDAAHGENSWEYYFEPVAGLSWGDLQGLVNDANHALTEDRVRRLTSGELWYLHVGEPDSVFNYPYGMHREASGDEAWYADQREKAHKVISKYITVRPEIADEVERQAEVLFQGRPVLGLHLRGTDKGTADTKLELMRIVPPEEYFSHIDRYLKLEPEACIFVATDQAQYVEILREKYGERVVSQEVLRADSTVNVFQTTGQNYRKGREVLMDALLLSKADFLLKCTSAVGEYAMYFNPDLRCIDLNHADKDLSWFERWKIKRGIKKRHKAVRRRQKTFRRAQIR